MKKFLPFMVVLALLTVLLLTGCGDAAPTPTQTPESTPSTEGSKSVTAANGISVTAEYLYDADTKEMLQLTKASVEMDSVPEDIKNVSCAVAATEDNYAVLSLTYKNADDIYQSETLYVYTDQ